MATNSPLESPSAVTSLPHSLRRRLMRWYCAHGRHELPWRKTRDPYAILASEVMLQQTQVDRVVPYYKAWLERWPTVEALAATRPADVIRAWAGLGYNLRALNLQRAAVLVVERHGGRLPLVEQDLRALPGVGAYTAAAVLSFAAHERVAVVETNIGRVIARMASGVAGHRELSPSALQDAATGFLPGTGRAARHHNLALMDLGATVCKPRQPLCDVCPLAVACCWRADGYPPSEVLAKPAPRFELTPRFARGRLIDMLRLRSPLSEAELAGGLPGLHSPRTRNYLEQLEREGMVERIEDGWSLPALHGSKSIASPKL